MILIFGIVNYIESRRLLQYAINNQDRMLAGEVSEAISRIINEEIEDAHVYVSDTSSHNYIIKSNSQYEGMTRDEIEARMLEMDNKWLSAGRDSALISGYIKNDVAQELSAIVSNDPDVAEIFVTDKYGALVAASNVTSDFYQADEEWWQAASGIRGKDVYIEDIVFDESAGMTGIVLAVPIFDMSLQFIGVCKIVLDADRVLEPLKGPKKPGDRQTALVDKEGKIIYHEKPEIIGKDFLAENNNWKNIFQTYSGSFVLDKPNLHNADSFVSYSEVRSPVLAKNNLAWKVFVIQGIKQAFRPLYELFLRELLLIIIMILFSVPLILVLISKLIKPLKYIFTGIKEIERGNLDYRTKKISNDEFGMLADLMNSMSSTLKETTTSISYLNKEIIRRKRVEENLRESRLRYRLLYDTSKDAIMILTPQGKFTSGNIAAVKLFNCGNEKEFVSYGPADLSPERQPGGKLSSEKAKEMIDIAVEKGSNLFDWMHKRINGDEFYATVLLSRFDINGQVFLQATVRDISVQKKYENDLKQANERLRRAQQQLVQAEKLEAVGRMASGIAHEVKNPLAIILQTVNYLESEVPAGDEKKQEALSVVKQNVKRADSIVRALLDFSRTSAMNMKPEKIDNAIDRALTLVEHEFRLKKINLLKEMSEDADEVKIDTNRIEQVFINLFSNAIYAMPEGGSLYLRSYMLNTKELEKAIPGITSGLNILHEEKVLVIEVEDTGFGIDEQNIKNVYDPFFTTKPKTEGTGLGLAVSRSIVDMHKGLIFIKSRKDKGTRVYLLFNPSGGEWYERD